MESDPARKFYKQLRGFRPKSGDVMIDFNGKCKCGAEVKISAETTAIFRDIEKYIIKCPACGHELVSKRKEQNDV